MQTGRRMEEICDRPTKSNQQRITTQLRVLGPGKEQGAVLRKQTLPGSQREQGPGLRMPIG